MKVEILGQCCPRCRRLFERAMEAKKELPAEVEIEKVEDLDRIVRAGILASPAIVINDRVVSQGRMLSASEIVQMVRKHLNTEGV